MVTALNQQEKRDLVFGIHDDDAIAAFKNWDRQQAEAMAEAMSIPLTHDHWRVIGFIRTYFANGGELQHARSLAEALTERFTGEGGAKYLFQLFPGGPVSQGCQLAGVPVPRDASDGAFGYQV